MSKTRFESKPTRPVARTKSKDNGSGADQSKLRERWLNSEEGQRTLARMAARDSKNSDFDRRAEAAGNVLADSTTLGTRVLAKVASFGAIDNIGPGGSGSSENNGSYSDDGYYDHYNNPYQWSCHWNSWWGQYHGHYGWGHFGLWSHCWNWGFGWYWNHCSWYWPYYGYGYGYRYPLAHSYTTIIYRNAIVEEDPEVEYIDEQVDEGELQEVQDPLTTYGQGSSSPETADRLSRATEYYLVLGDRAFLEGRYGATVHYYAKAIEFSPDQGMLYLLLSDALFATGDYSYAASMLRKALELEPGLATNVIDKHDLYSNPDDFDEQLARLEAFVLDHPIDEDASLLLAVNYLFSGQPERATEFLDLPENSSLLADPIGLLIQNTAATVDDK